MIRRLLLGAVATLLLFPACRAQAPQAPFWRTTPADSLLAEQILADLRGCSTALVPYQMCIAAGDLVGQPYVAGTLEETDREELAIYLTRTDCILFVETCLALARTSLLSGDFATLAAELRASRYRDGQVRCYADRLHYTSEWILQAERRGVLREITAELGGVPYDHPVSYMSTHPEAYPRMDDVEAIRAAEARINAVPVCIIPKEKVAGVLPKLRRGDILCFAAATTGLDILHVGIVFAGGEMAGPVGHDGNAGAGHDGKPKAGDDEKAKVRLIHASSAAGRVIVDPKTIPAYLEGRPSIAGLRILRPNPLPF